VRADELGVTLLHDGPHLLPELPQALGRAAAASLAGRGVDVRLGTRARRVRADGVDLAALEETNGSGAAEVAIEGAIDAAIDAATVVCTIGTRPNPLLERLALPRWLALVAELPPRSMTAFLGTAWGKAM